MQVQPKARSFAVSVLRRSRAYSLLRWTRHRTPLFLLGVTLCLVIRQPVYTAIYPSCNLKPVCCASVTLYMLSRPDEHPTIKSRRDTLQLVQTICTGPSAQREHVRAVLGPATLTLWGTGDTWVQMRALPHGHAKCTDARGVSRRARSEPCFEHTSRTS